MELVEQKLARNNLLDEGLPLLQLPPCASGYYRQHDERELSDHLRIIGSLRLRSIRSHSAVEDRL